MYQKETYALDFLGGGSLATESEAGGQKQVTNHYTSLHSSTLCLT